MAQPYFVASQIIADIPALQDNEQDNNRITRYGQEADNEIDNMLESFITVPLSTVPAVITTASNDMTKSKYWRDDGDVDKANSFLASAKKIITDYIKTITQNNPESSDVIVEESTRQTEPMLSNNP